MGPLRRGLGFVASLARTAYEEEIRYPAAALAYYAFVSFVPLLVLVFAATGEHLTDELARTVPRLLTPRVQRLVDRSLATASGHTGAGLLAVLVLAWSAVNVVGDVRTVVGRVEGDGALDGSPWSWARDACAILGGLVAAILAVVATSSLFEFPPAGSVGGLAGFLSLWVALTGAFLPLYYVPSGLVGSPAGALPGAAAASVGWTTLHTAVQFYATHAGTYAVYGVLSGVIVVFTSLYLAAAVLLTGFVVNARVATDAPRG